MKKVLLLLCLIAQTIIAESEIKNYWAGERCSVLSKTPKDGARERCSKICANNNQEYDGMHCQDYTYQLQCICKNKK